MKIMSNISLACDSNQTRRERTFLQLEKEMSSNRENNVSSVSCEMWKVQNVVGYDMKTNVCFIPSDLFSVPRQTSQQWSGMKNWLAFNVNINILQNQPGVIRCCSSLKWECSCVDCTCVAVMNETVNVKWKRSLTSGTKRSCGACLDSLRCDRPIIKIIN